MENLCLSLLPSVMEYDFIGQFREGKAPARNGKEWFHIREDRRPAYFVRGDWVGPFVEGFAPFEMSGEAYHIGHYGKPAYPYRFDKVGVFSYTIAWGWIAWVVKDRKLFFIRQVKTEKGIIFEILPS